MARGEFAPNALRDGDAFFLEGVVAAAYQDGKIDVTGTPEEAEWKSHGSHWGVRTGVGVGYRFDERWTAALSFNHFSNADTAQPNEGTNDIGLRIGLRL
jgi:lipid A 3-O-deacylase